GTYGSLDEVREYIAANAAVIDSIVSDMELPDAVRIGKANKTELWDYPQGINTMDFLINL
ncbi:MAG: hypothetical protein J6Z26_07310, partial [Bacteroidales bacterium]|nr:hypothetical protein [Bacteroidales bacterium]